MEKKISAERAQKRAKEAKTAIMKTSRNELEKKVMDFEHEMEELSAAQSKAIAAAVEAELKDLKAQTHEEKANAQRFKDLAEKWESRAGKWKAKYDEAAQSVAKYKSNAFAFAQPVLLMHIVLLLRMTQHWRRRIPRAADLTMADAAAPSGLHPHPSLLRHAQPESIAGGRDRLTAVTRRLIVKKYVTQSSRHRSRK